MVSKLYQFAEQHDAQHWKRAQTDSCVNKIAKLTSNGQIYI